MKPLFTEQANPSHSTDRAALQRLLDERGIAIFDSRMRLYDPNKRALAESVREEWQAQINRPTVFSRLCETVLGLKI